MKIGIFDPYLDTLAGGEKYILTVASCLAEKNDVSILWDEKKEKELKEKIKTKFGFSIDFIPFEKNIFNAAITFPQRFFKSRKYDVLIALSDGSIPFVACNLFLHFQSPLPWVGKPSVKTKIKLSRVKKIFCNSLFTKSYIDKKFGINSVILYPPLIRVPNDEKIEKENVILNVGRYGIKEAGSSYKKQEVMVDTFIAMVRNGLKKWEFVLVMSIFSPKQEEELKELEKRIEGFPIRIDKNPNNAALWHYYKKAKIYWHAAGFGENIDLHPDRAEHFGIATVEAMSMGTVPVVIDAGGQKEIVDEGENGFLWNTQKELEEKTEQIIKNEPLRKKLSEKAQEKASKYEQGRFCQELRVIIG